jgi:hypothetical protein
VSTPFPSTPKDVPALSIQEFALDLDIEDDPPLDAICARFLNDANRAFVWLIRFRALQAWRARPGTTDWMRASSRTMRDACDVAAGFELTGDWEFDAQDFAAAVSALASHRARTG